MRVEPLTDADWEAFERLREEYLPDDDPDRIRAAYQRDPRLFLLLKDGDAAVGAAYGRLRDADAGEYALDGIAVRAPLGARAGEPAAPGV